MVFQALSPEDQQEALERIAHGRASRDADSDGLAARMVDSLRVAAKHAGRVPSADDYRLAVAELRRQNVEIEPFSRVLRWAGSWRRAKEALELAAHASPLRVEARLRSRRLDKIWRYSEETLRECVIRCSDDIGGRAPRLAEYEWWRRREIDQAGLEGNDALHLPSGAPYRRRWSSWEKALAHFGFSGDQISARFE